MKLHWYCLDCGCYFNFSSGSTRREPEPGHTLNWKYGLPVWTQPDFPHPLCGECFRYHTPVLEIELV